MAKTPLRTLLLGLLVGAFLLLPVSVPGLARADEGGETEDLLGGFDDSDDDSDEAEEDTSWGFDDDDDDELAAGEELGSAQELESPRWWDVTGDIGLGSSYNYRSHWSGTDDPMMDQIAPDRVRTNWGGLSSLRLDLYLQLDLDLPASWKARISGWGFYDFVFLIHGNRNYTDQVLDMYEWEVDFREVWVQGSLLDNLDLKLGRQIVNWGRSDSLRVLDIFNPLDNREPGLVDIEDLKRPVTMLRLDYFLRGALKDWNLQLLVVPEIRYSQDPPYGSDFNPLPFPIERDRPRHWGEVPEFGLAVNGIFHGWDISFYGAYYYDERTWMTFEMGGLLQSLDPLQLDASVEAVERQSRLAMGGVGANYTVGSWLLKGELAYLHGFEFAHHALDLSGFPMVWFGPDRKFDDKSRWDVMAGVEYYGFSDTQIAVEIAYRHLNDFEEGSGEMPFTTDPPGLDLDYESGMDNFPNYALEHRMTTAIRITQELMNDRLELTALGIIFSNDTHLGSIVRLSGEFEVRDALLVGGGIVLYQEGDSIEFQQVGRNDRIFLEVEYSF
jgi:hypothetical protein